MSARIDLARIVSSAFHVVSEYSSPAWTDAREIRRYRSAITSPASHCSLTTPAFNSQGPKNEPILRNAADPGRRATKGETRRVSGSTIPKIGRASCRERGQDQGAARSGTKKRKENATV